jgi:hypothetical protein
VTPQIQIRLSHPGRRRPKDSVTVIGPPRRKLQLPQRRLSAKQPSDDGGRHQRTQINIGTAPGEADQRSSDPGPGLGTNKVIRTGQGQQRLVHRRRVMHDQQVDRPAPENVIHERGSRRQPRHRLTGITVMILSDSRRGRHGQSI